MAYRAGSAEARSRGLHCAGAARRLEAAVRGLRSHRHRACTGSGTSLHLRSGTFASVRSSAQATCPQRALPRPFGAKSGTLRPALACLPRSLRQKSHTARFARSPPSVQAQWLTPSRPRTALVGLCAAPAPLRPLLLAGCLHL